MISFPIPTETTYEDVEKMILNLIWRNSPCSHCTFNDRLSTAHYAYVNARDSWNPEGLTKFSTYVHNRTKCALRTECRKCHKHRKIFIYDTNLVENLSPRIPNGFWAMLGEMSEDVQAVGKILIEAPKELVEVLTDRYKGQDLLRSYLYGMGWGALRITKCFSEIKEALR